MSLSPIKASWLAIISVSCVLLLLVHLTLRLLELPKGKNDETDGKKNLSGEIDSTRVKSLQASLLLQYQTQGARLPKGFIVKDSYGTPISLSQLVDKKPKVVFYYSELSCQVCVDHEIENIKRFSRGVGKESILIISSYRHHKNLNIFKRVHSLDLEVYNRENVELGLPIDKANRSCLFLTDSSMVIKAIFVPVKEIDELSNVFYHFANEVLRQYSKSDGRKP